MTRSCLSHDYAITQSDAEFAVFRAGMVARLREIADQMERGDGYVVAVVATCDYEGNGGPFVMIDGEAATVDLVDEIVETLKNAMFEALE